MIFILLFIILSSTFYKEITIGFKEKTPYFLGLALLPLNVYWVHYISGGYFEGSDTYTYYNWAVSFSNNKDALYSQDIRYIGYNLYQLVVAYPFIENEKISSILIKITNWSFFYYSITHLFLNLRKVYNKDLVKDKFIHFSILLMGLWLSSYNFRDVVILSLLIYIISYYLGNNRLRVPILISLLFVLFFFRYLYVALILTSFFIAIIVTKKQAVRLQIKTKINLLVTFLILMVLGFFFINKIDYLNFILSQNQDIINQEASFEIRSSNYFLSLASGLFAGNPIDFLTKYFFEDINRTIVITPLTAFLMSSIFLYSYVFYLQSFVAMISARKIINTVDESNRRVIVVSIAIILFVFFVNLVYSLSYGDGVQERIRATILPLLGISIFLFYNYDKYYFTAIKRVAIMMVLFVFYVRFFTSMI